MTALTRAQRAALELTHRGLHTLIVAYNELHMQPPNIVDAVRELPSLVDLGLMTRETLDLFPTKVKYSLTAAGTAELLKAPS